MKNTVFVIGSINQDIVAYVDRHPKIGETVPGYKLEYHPGGKGANQAIACAKLGGDVSLFANVGRDEAGKRLLKYLRKQDVDCGHVEILDDQPTGCALITVDKNSENSIVVVPGANKQWRERSGSSAVFCKNDIVMAQFEVPLAVVEFYFHRAREIGAKTILNPSPIQAVPARLFALVDYLIVNEIELAQISNGGIELKDNENILLAAKKLEKKYNGTLIVTLGGDGVRIMENGKWHCLKAPKVTAVDTTGAGDCFAGALAAALVVGKSILQAADFGNRAAAVSVTKPGAAPSMPSLSEIGCTNGI